MDRVGNHCPIVWDVEWSYPKLMKIIYTTALDGRQLANQHTTTNQKQAAATEGSMEGICDKWDTWGTCDSIVLVARRCK
jgi:hypothetical protein